MNTKVLEKILTTDEQYWIIRKDENSTGFNAQKFTNSIIMCTIPENIKQGKKREEITIVDLEELQGCNHTNIYLNSDTPPFQLFQNFYRVTDCYPITCNKKEFLIKALLLDSDDIWDYKKIIDELLLN